MKGMWLFVLFDLPVKKRIQRKQYTEFRRNLIAEGFSMLQYSVYAVYCTSRENSITYYNHVKKRLPEGGQVRVVSVTDKQFSDMAVFYGKTQKKPEEKPENWLFY